jgi:hypothetical protein
MGMPKKPLAGGERLLRCLSGGLGVVRRTTTSDGGLGEDHFLS